MSLHAKNTEEAATQQQQHQLENNKYYNNNNDLKDTSFMPNNTTSTTTETGTTPLRNAADNKSLQNNTTSSSFIHIPPPPVTHTTTTSSSSPTTATTTTVPSESMSNSNSLSRRSLDVHTLDIHEPQHHHHYNNNNINNKQQHEQWQLQLPSTPTLSTNSKLNSTTHEYTSTNGVPHGHYRNTLPPQDDNFKLFTIYGNGEFPKPPLAPLQPTIALTFYHTFFFNPTLKIFNIKDNHKPTNLMLL